MSWVFKKSALEEEGGFAAFSEYLAEDFFMGKALWNRFDIFISHLSIYTIIGHFSFYLVMQKTCNLAIVIVN